MRRPQPPHQKIRGARSRGVDRDPNAPRADHYPCDVPPHRDRPRRYRGSKADMVVSPVSGTQIRASPPSVALPAATRPDPHQREWFDPSGSGPDQPGRPYPGVRDPDGALLDRDAARIPVRPDDASQLPGIRVDPHQPVHSGEGRMGLAASGGLLLFAPRPKPQPGPLGLSR